MAGNTTGSLDKLICFDYVDFGNCRDRIGQISWSKSDCNYLVVKLEVFKKDDNEEFRLLQNLTMGEANFSQFIRLRNELVNAAESFAGEKNLSEKNLDEQLKLSHQKLVDVVDRANRKICVILLRYSVDKPERCYAADCFFARKKEDEKFE